TELVEALLHIGHAAHEHRISRRQGSHVWETHERRRFEMFGFERLERVLVRWSGMAAPFELAGVTHAGRLRPTNEDRVVIDPALGLAIVADGIAGSAAGEVAA